jgi:hypothetical protein
MSASPVSIVDPPSDTLSGGGEVSLTRARTD